MGSVVRYKAIVTVDDGNTAETLTIKVKLDDGVSPATLYASNAHDVATNDYLVIKGEFVVRDVTASGVVYNYAESIDNDDTWTQSSEVAGSVTSIDFTNAVDLVVTGDWSVGGNDTCRLEMFSVTVD